MSAWATRGTPCPSPYGHGVGPMLPLEPPAPRRVRRSASLSAEGFGLHGRNGMARLVGQARAEQGQRAPLESIRLTSRHDHLLAVHLGRIQQTLPVVLRLGGRQREGNG